jgi:hypothetical protein
MFVWGRRLGSCGGERRDACHGEEEKHVCGLRPLMVTEEGQDGEINTRLEGRVGPVGYAEHSILILRSSSVSEKVDVASNSLELISLLYDPLIEATTNKTRECVTRRDRGSHIKFDFILFCASSKSHSTK